MKIEFYNGAQDADSESAGTFPFPNCLAIQIAESVRFAFGILPMDGLGWENKII